jgi:hypothetical protein
MVTVIVARRRPADPGGQVVAEVLGPALAPGHEVLLVAAVRRLGVHAPWCEHLDAWRAVPEGDDERLVLRRG